MTQQVLMIENGEDEKRQILTDFILKMDPLDKVMIFVGRKARADDISSDLSLQGRLRYDSLLFTVFFRGLKRSVAIMRGKTCEF